MLPRFHPLVAQWFQQTLGAPTAAQERGWAAIRDGRHTLIAAPTGSGKTLAAFLSAIDELVQEGIERPLPDEVRLVYVSPLKALSADIHKNLAEPRRGIRDLAEALGMNAPRITAAVRTGDTTPSERAAMLRKPPHILVTTPESLYLLLTSARSREMLRTARTVIVDEIHAVIGGRRGAHLALSLERLESIVRADLKVRPYDRPLSNVPPYDRPLSNARPVDRPLSNVRPVDRPLSNVRTVDRPLSNVEAGLQAPPGIHRIRLPPTHKPIEGVAKFLRGNRPSG